MGKSVDGNDTNSLYGLCNLLPQPLVTAATAPPEPRRHASRVAGKNRIAHENNLGDSGRDAKGWDQKVGGELTSGE